MRLGRLHHQGLSILLVLSLTVSSVWPSLAYSNGNASSSAAAGQQVAELLRNSKRLTPGQPRATFPLDRFLLLEQEVHKRSYVGRDFSIASTANERELDEHAARIDILRALVRHVRVYRGESLTGPDDPCEPFVNQPAFSSQEIKKAATEHVNRGRAKDVPLFVWEARRNLSQLTCLDERLTELLGAWESQHLELLKDKNSRTEIPNFTEAPEQFRNRYFNWWDLSVSLIERNGEPVDHFRLKTTADHHAIDNNNSYTCDESCEIKLKAGNELLHTLHLPVRAMTSFGPYLVFVHDNSYDSDSGIQHLSFLDLASFGTSIGNADIPVFRLPVLMSEAVRSLEVRNQKLILNGRSTIPVEAFIAGSELQQIAFNLEANLVDPEDIADVLPYIESLHLAFEKIMRAQIQDATEDGPRGRQAVVLLKDLGRQIEDQVRNNHKFTQILDTGGMRELLNAFGDGVHSSQQMRERTRRIAERITASRTLNGRLEILFRKILSPKPNASLKIRRALVMVGFHRHLDQGRFWSFIADRPWLHTTVLAAGILAMASPSTFIDVAEAGLAFGNGVFDCFKFSLLGLMEAIGKGAAATFTPLTDFGATLMKQYVSDGNYSKTLIGLAAYVPFLLSCYYVPHLIFNLHKIYLDSRNSDWSGFVDNQRRFVRDYYQRLADDEAKRRHLENERDESTRVEFTDEENLAILEFLEQRKSESPAYRPPGRIGRLWIAAKDKTASLIQTISRSKTVTEDGADSDKIKGLWSALVSVGFSYPAMELSLSQWVRFWNWFAGARYSAVSFLTLRDIGLKSDVPIFIRPKPVTSMVRLIYPDFFNTTVAKRGPQLTVPTDLNGGLRTWGLRDLVWLRETLFGKSSERRAVEEEIRREWTLSELKAATEAFEAGILSVEDAVFQQAFLAAVRRLADFVTDKDQLASLFKSRPLKSAFEQRVRELPSNIRTFVRLYTEEIYGRSMRDYLQAEFLRLEGEATEAKTEGLTALELKERLIRFRQACRESTGLRFDSDRAVEMARRHVTDEALFRAVSKQASRGEWSIHNWLVNRKYNVIADFDPQQNGAMANFGVVQERLKSPNALSRAVRSEISKLLVTMPLDLAFKLVLAAGIFEGAFKPIQDEFWGTNSVFHLSRDTFYMGMASGFVMSMAADGWVKMLEDARQDDLGGFGTIPKGQDATSFFRWFSKQFSDKSNSLFANWGYVNTIVFRNLPAGLASTGFFYEIFSGRMDLSLIFASYVVSFASPLAAFYYKVDQAFERAVDFAAREIPEERWLAHPAVQEVISKEKQYYRNRFQLLADMYTNVQMNLLHNIEVIPTSLGTRGFVRSLLYGNLVEELLVDKLFTPLRAVTDGVPLLGKTVGAATGLCEHLFTNGNTDLWKKN